jgi:hypothetical protein
MVSGRMRQLPEIQTFAARRPELPPGPAVLGINPSADDYLRVQPPGCQEEDPADNYASHLPGASDDP